ncbi:MAG: DUF3575 domain-containing protein [Bacteroidota bacterium]
MKKTLLTLFLGVTAIGLSQDTNPSDDHPRTNQKHEIRLDALEALAVNTIELNYEYIISKFSGVGAAISIGFDGDDIENYHKFAFSPYYRQYFFNKKDFGARGLFAEGLLQFATGEEVYSNFLENGNIETGSNDWTNFGIGFALGQKWVSKNGFVLEISIGGGRYFGNAEGSPEGFVRGGILVGYRF